MKANKMRDYFMIDCSGDLCDTRKPDWHNNPIRKGYAKVERDVSDNSIALRAAIRTKYTFPGGYELIGFTSDGACLCCYCMRENYWHIAHSKRYKISDGWRVVAIDTTANYDDLLYCENCNKTLVEQSEEESK